MKTHLAAAAVATTGDSSMIKTSEAGMSDRERGRVEDTVDEDGYVVRGYSWWLCDCGEEIRRYRGTGDQTCRECGQEFNAFGQRLASDWRRNASNWDDEVSDMDGYEASYAGEDW